MRQIILSLLKKDTFKAHYATALKCSREEAVKDILRGLEVTHERTQGDLSLDDLLLGIRSCYPQKKADTLCAGIEAMRGTIYDAGLVQDYLIDEARKSFAYDLALSALEVSEGTGDFGSMIAKAQSYDMEEKPLAYDFVTHDLEELRQHQIAKGGLKWRLNTLNKLLGHLPKKTFGFIYARPCTGKTSLLASEITFMARQLPADKPVLWVANEEDAVVVKVRCLQAIFSITEAQLWANLPEYKAKYEKHFGDKLMITGDPNINHRRGIEEACASLKPGLVLIDQLDKIGGFKADKPEQRLGAAYRWARDLSKEYDCPVIGVTQANSAADGQKYLRMNHISESHTAKAAEADWILGIGKDYGAENLRYLHTPKDKLPMSEGKVAEMRHGYAEVEFKPEVARYADTAYNAQ